MQRHPVHHRALPGKPQWESVKNGEWQFGRGLALAWRGEAHQADVEFRAAAEKFRLRGEEELLARVSLHRLILECRREADPERRHRMATRVASRLLTQRQVEDYSPPFARVAGSRLAESLWRDLARAAFLLPAAPEAGEDLAAEDWAPDRLAG